MKSFRDYLKEDVVPTAIVQDGSIDLEREVVRAQINSSLASVLADPSVTPYNALVRASKVLSYFSIILPKRVYLDGEKGIEAIELRQFGDRMGMTDQGEFVKEVPGKFYLFIQYWRTHPNVVPYAATANFISSTGGMFKVAAKVVDKVELDRLIDMAEVSLAESAESRQAMAKAIAPKEEPHTALGDCDCSQGDSPSTKSAVSTMMRKTDKKLAADSLDEAMTRKQKDIAVRRFMSHDPEAGERILKMGKKEREEKKSFASAKKEIKRLKEEEQIDEVSKRAAISAYRGKEAQERDTDKLHGLIKRKFGKETAKHAERAGAADTGNLFRRGESHGVDRLASAKSSSEMRKTKSGKIHGQDVASKKSEIKFRKSMSKFDKKGYLPEETQIDELKKSTLASYIKKAHVSGLEAASKGEIAYARKDKAGLRAANKTGEKREQGIERAASKLAKEETMEEGRMPASVIASKKKYAEMSDKDFAEKHGHKSEKELRDMAARHGYGFDKATKTGSDHYVKRVSSAKQVDEAMGSVKKTYAMKKMKKKVNTQVKQGLGIGKERTNTVLVTNKGDPAAAGGGGVHRIPRDKYDPKKHNLASE